MKHSSMQAVWPGLALILAGGFVLSGCTQDNRDLQQYIADVKERPGSGIEPIPTLEPHEPYLYPGHTRSPFDSSVIAQPAPAAAEGQPGDAEVDPDRPREFLEGFPLDSLRMVGSLEQDGVRYALVRTPDRGIQRVTEGNYMGQNHGEIVEITPTQIRLIEIVPDAFGGHVERENSVALTE
ncbi:MULTISPECIES: pilus assembly protein PilP [unclassified Thioalkalivibrio]|uniref:pilus assembly protein PilP n=1 Tax=unclassified Thioalkalivibrio TaxID=2621013 RepID=UPI000365B9FC|nr:MULTISPECIES: pilus assembly protein PilP [unclassified Thioalkalivibrio]